jgi:membrane dipeptidase
MARMRKPLLRAGVSCAVLVLPVLVLTQSPPSDGVSARAKQLHDRAIVIDTHADTTQRLFFDKTFDISVRQKNGNIDVPRMREGGLDALFFSIWVPSDVTGPPAVKRAMDLIDATREAARLHPDQLMLATTAADIRRAAAEHKIAALMGMEGGHMIDDDMRLLRLYAALGVRYMTLTHFKNNNWADSSTDKPAHNGLTPFGKDVVREMNRLGMMVDISHTADKTFYDALEVSTAPIIASHSSCRAVSNHTRNMTDDMIRALAAKGGTMQINFDCAYLSQRYSDAAKPIMAELRPRFQEAMKIEDPVARAAAIDQLQQESTSKLPPATLADVVAQIDHAVKVGGIDHVGIGTDFDGVGCVPAELSSYDKFPVLTRALLEKGYSAADIKKIYGGNLLRVMHAVELRARELKSTPPIESKISN